jgi:NADH dehydrogenase
MRQPGTPPLITVFGGDGFIGRYVCEALLKTGGRLRVASRDPRRAWFIQPLGSVGQMSAVRADITKPATVERAVDGVDAVINLVGIFNGNLEAVHVEGAGKLAAAARKAGAGAFVHISAIGVDPDSESTYSHTKARGEEAVRKAFPKATIIRPSTVFGAEDDFTNRFGAMSGWPILPVISAKSRFQPVYVRDLAKAIAAAALDPKAHGGKTYELAGPEAMTMLELNRKIAELSGQKPDLVEVPDFVAAGIAMFGFLPGAPLNRDQWLMLQSDNVPSGKQPGFKEFGITPMPLGAVAADWLSRFRKGGRFNPGHQLPSAG